MFFLVLLASQCSFSLFSIQPGSKHSLHLLQNHSWTGKPTTVPLTPGSTTRVLQKAQKRQKEKNKTNKQTTRASNTRKLSTLKPHPTNNTKKTKARPRREKGERVDQPKVGKRFLPPHSCRLAILPIRERVGRDGPSARGG